MRGPTLPIAQCLSGLGPVKVDVEIWLTTGPSAGQLLGRDIPIYHRFGVKVNLSSELV